MHTARGGEVRDHGAALSRNFVELKSADRVQPETYQATQVYKNDEVFVAQPIHSTAGSEGRTKGCPISWRAFVFGEFSHLQQNYLEPRSLSKFQRKFRKEDEGFQQHRQHR